MDKQLNNCLDKAKHIAIKYVKDIDVAEEIAQLSVIQLFLNYDKIDNEKINSWLFTVTRNLCMDFYRKSSDNKEILVDPLELSKRCVYEEIEAPQDLDIDTYSFLSATDKKILKKYYNENVALEKLAQDFKIKTNALKAKIYSLSNEIKLYHLINSDVKYFTPTPATKFTKNINRFISVMLKALNTNDLSLLKRYCKDAVIHKNIDKIKIKSYDNCKIIVYGNNIYDLIIAYLDFESKIRIFKIKFTITDSSHLQVIEMPIIPKEVLIIDKKFIDPKKSEKELLNRRGAYNFKLGSVAEMKKKGIAKVIQTRDDFSDE